MRLTTSLPQELALAQESSDMLSALAEQVVASQHVIAELRAMLQSQAEEMRMHEEMWDYDLHLALQDLGDARSACALAVMERDVMRALLSQRDALAAHPPADSREVSLQTEDVFLDVEFAEVPCTLRLSARVSSSI